MFVEGKYLELDMKLQLASSPLRQIAKMVNICFIHKSFDEYFAAMRLI